MRTRSVIVSGFASAAMMVAGCGSKPLQTVGPTGTGGGSILTGAGGSGPTGTGGFGWIDGGAIDAPVDAPFAGRRSFIVQSQLRTEGGVSSHAFTMVVDVDRRTAIVGANGGGMAAGLQQVADGTLRLDRAVVFSLPVQGACSASVRYDSLAFNLDTAGGLTGGGVGQLMTVQGDVAFSAPVTASLTGAPDTVAPRLTLSPAGDLTDPFTTLWVASPEPLPVESYPTLRAAGGDVVVLTPAPGAGDPFITGFSKPGVMLRYGETYTVDVADVTDFAGNWAAAGDWLTFTTKPLPPLAAADGFESVTGATLGGAKVISGAGAPTISGSRSLYIPPVTTYGAPATTQLALRLAIAPGNTVVRFSFRDVNANATAVFGAEFRIASVGGSIVAMSPPVASGTGTSVVIDGTSVTLGPVTTATINLPADAADEVGFARMTRSFGGCSGPLPLPAGIIIDDLRAE